MKTWRRSLLEGVMPRRSFCTRWGVCPSIPEPCQARQGCGEDGLAVVAFNIRPENPAQTPSSPPPLLAEVTDVRGELAGVSQLFCPDTPSPFTKETERPCLVCSSRLSARCNGALVGSGTICCNGCFQWIGWIIRQALKRSKC